MLKKITLLLSVLVLFSCSEKKSNKNLQITGAIKGFKKGALYIQKIKDTSFINLDTIVIDGNSNFSTELDLSSPEMLYLFIDRGTSSSVDNYLAFFAEPGKINIETSLDFFTSDAKITGSKNHDLYEEYKYVVSRYTDEDLELIKKKFEAYKSKNLEEVLNIEKKQQSIIKRKYLYTTNFAVNHSDYAIAPYLATTEIYDINLKFLDTINKSMTPQVANGFYGKKLKNLLSKRKISEE